MMRLVPWSAGAIGCPEIKGPNKSCTARIALPTGDAKVAVKTDARRHAGWPEAFPLCRSHTDARSGGPWALLERGSLLRTGDCAFGDTSLASPWKESTYACQMPPTPSRRVSATGSGVGADRHPHESKVTGFALPSREGIIGVSSIAE